MKTSSLCTALLALTLPLAAQKMATPAGEAPGPWILGTIGVGKGPDPKTPLRTALKGLAIKVGEKGEAAVAYDLDLCRMVGAWTGEFTTPMNLMSRGEYPAAMGEVAFTTGEVPGFLPGVEGTAGGKIAPQQSKSAHPAPQGENPVPRGDDLQGRGATVAPQTGIPVHQGDHPESRGEKIAPQKTNPAPQENPAERREEEPARQRGNPAPRGEGLGRRGDDLAGQKMLPTAQNIPLATRENIPAAPQNLLAGWPDPRPEPFGPLPPGQARFQGFHVNGDKTILKWDIGGTEVLEMPGYEEIGGTMCFTRTLFVHPHREPLQIILAEGDQAAEASEGASELLFGGTAFRGQSVASPINCGGKPFVVSVGAIESPKVSLLFCNSQVYAVLPPSKGPAPAICKIVLRPGTYDLKSSNDLGFLEGLGIRGGPARWPETVTTAGEVSDKGDEAYVVDTIKLPDPNPWGAPMFVGGFDFFLDGRAAVCTFHGDVFVVSGLSDSLEKVTWRRFASGLYHALGLKVVNGEIYVTCRDGLWRLKDLNGDGECDFYEAFNFDLKVTKNFHEFVFDLQTDPAGNFYYAKAGPVKNGGRGFDQIMAHHGALLRVSPDGAKLDVVATGFRAPNGIGCGPDGQLTSGDNEGTWTPACKINWIQPGGFYGVVDLAHRDPPPSDYDRPLCWLPKRADNSGGGQVWVPPGDKWGPWGGQMLHLSYGTCSVFGVLKETVRPTAEGTVPPGVAPPEIPALPPVVQGGVVRFPVNFQSGIMRARFNPADGQLYVGGLRGWQTTGVKNGAFQRVRYTGAPVRMPIGLHATKRGVRLDFSTPLDPATATDPQNWNMEVWNYLWSSAYGSPELSTIEATEKPAELGRDGEPQFTKAQAALKKHDPLTVKSATLSADGKSVFLEIPEIKPVMQMAIKVGIQSADGAELRSEVINTIHALAAE